MHGRLVAQSELRTFVGQRRYPFHSKVCGRYVQSQLLQAVRPMTYRISTYITYYLAIHP